jgi:DNA-binding PadR family transcriptional regulator
MPTSLERLCYEILEYLDRHPQAQDTLEGIAEWWLMEQRIQNEMNAVKRALRALLAQDLITERRAAGDRCYYRLNDSKQAEVKALLSKKARALGKAEKN